MRRTLSLVLSLVFLAGCAGAAPSPATPTATAVPSATETPGPTNTPQPTATATYPPDTTPPDLPTTFTTVLLNPQDTPHTYVQDSCQYLKDKWNSTDSAPGTVLMSIMFHSIGSDTTGDTISVDDFHTLMQTLHDDGFEAIDMSQAIGFMENNAKIPARSVLLIVDDRRTKDYYDLFFRPYHDQWDWPVVNAWISTPLSSADLWQQQVDLEKEGWVDHEAHGVVHNLPMGPGTSSAYATSELQGSIDAFKQYFNKAPLAIIWPGGEFTHDATLIARQLGYHLGFTATPRGPVMFNWVPLDDAADPNRPAFEQDGYVKDPLMVIPRYWDTDAIKHLDAVMQIGDAATAYAQANKATEQEYYDILCTSQTGPLP